MTRASANSCLQRNAGLAHLKGLTNLGFLTLIDTQITGPGIADLKKSLPNCKIVK